MPWAKYVKVRAIESGREGRVNKIFIDQEQNDTTDDQ